MLFSEKKRWVFFALPFTFTSYEATEEIITIKEGFLSRKENSCYMYKVTDVELTESLLERIFQLGSIVCYTGDVTHPQLRFEHIRNAGEIKGKLLQFSEEQRRKNRTINTQDIDGNFQED